MKKRREGNVIICLVIAVLGLCIVLAHALHRDRRSAQDDGASNTASLSTIPTYSSSEVGAGKSGGEGTDSDSVFSILAMPDMIDRMEVRPVISREEYSEIVDEVRALEAEIRSRSPEVFGRIEGTKWVGENQEWECKTVTPECAWKCRVASFGLMQAGRHSFEVKCYSKECEQEARIQCDEGGHVRFFDREAHGNSPYVQIEMREDDTVRYVSIQLGLGRYLVTGFDKRGVPRETREITYRDIKLKM